MKSRRNFGNLTPFYFSKGRVGVRSLCRKAGSEFTYPAVQTAAGRAGQGPGQQRPQRPQGAHDLATQQQQQGQEDTYDLGHDAVAPPPPQQQQPEAYLDVAPRPELDQHAALAQPPRAQAVAMAGLTSYDHGDDSEEEI